MALFKPVQGRKVPEHVADQILDLVRRGKLEAGTRLPAERELAQQLAVGRSTLREAVRVLEARGIIEVRHGVGTFLSIQAPDIEETNLLPWLSANLEDILQILELREALEVKAVRLAARNPDEADLLTLESIIARSAKAAESGESVVVADLDLEFHNQIAMMANNKFLLPLSRSIRAVNDHRAMLQLPGRVLASVAEHRSIVQALRAQNPEKAARCMGVHMASVIRAVSSVRNTGGDQDARDSR